MTAIVITSIVSPPQSGPGSMLLLNKDFVLHTDDDCDLKLREKKTVFLIISLMTRSIVCSNWLTERTS